MIRHGPDRTLPPELAALAATLPRRVTRRQGGDIISRTLFPVSPRSLERWPLATRVVNGKATFDTRELLGEALR